MTHSNYDDSEHDFDDESLEINLKKRSGPIRKLLKFIKWFFAGIFTCALFGLIIASLAYFYFAQNLPDVSELQTIKPQGELRVYSKEGHLIASFGERRRIPLTYEQIPQIVIDAVVTTEDSRFFQHHGVDPVGIVRAVMIGIENGGRFSQGGSTITQQVAKNYFLTPEKKISRKIKEAILAIKIEDKLSKEDIITLYLNMINFGSRAYGIGAAAKTFFNKDVKELTLSEAALLAGLPNAPSAYNPIYNPKDALKRRNWVLSRMLEENVIDSEQYKHAIEEPLGTAYHPPKIDFHADYVAEMARQYMVDKYGQDAAYNNNYSVYTTISKKTQNAMTNAVVKQLLVYDHASGYRGPEEVLWTKENTDVDTAKLIKKGLNSTMCFQELCPAVVIDIENNQAIAQLKSGQLIKLTMTSIAWIKETNKKKISKINDLLNPGQLIRVKRIENDSWQLEQIPQIEGAAVVMNSKTGAVDGLVGGFDFYYSKFNRATQAIRQIGSAVKPFIYAAALNRGLTLGSVINDTPITRSGGSFKWRPKNSPENYQGPTLLREGIAKSKNVMMIRVMRAIGVQYAADYLQRFGFPDDNITRNESLALGSASFTPLQLARGHATLVNGGYLITPYFIDKISEGDKTIYEHTPLIACDDCPSTVDKIDLSKLLLDNTEIESTDSEAEEPNKNNLKANETILLPESQSNVTANDDDSNEVKYAPQVISSEISYLMRDALKTVIWGGQNYNGNAWRSKVLNRHDIGGKTGTTNGPKDVWFAGYMGDQVGVVWVGYDDFQVTIRQGSGGKTANPVWTEFMQSISKDVPFSELKRPNDIINVTIDKKTGLLSDDGVDELFIKGTEPQEYYTPTVDSKIIDEDGNSKELF